MLGRCLEHVKQGRDEGINAATQILHIDQDDIESAHRLAGGAANLAVQAEHRNAMHRVGEVEGFHHIVLLVAAQPMLRPESSSDIDVAERRERIERMC
jgi:hypothetical protein